MIVAIFENDERKHKNFYITMKTHILHIYTYINITHIPIIDTRHSHKTKQNKHDYNT